MLLVPVCDEETVTEDDGSHVAAGGVKDESGAGALEHGDAGDDKEGAGDITDDTIVDVEEHNECPEVIEANTVVDRFLVARKNVAPTELVGLSEHISLTG